MYYTLYMLDFYLITLITLGEVRYFPACLLVSDVCLATLSCSQLLQHLVSLLRRNCQLLDQPASSSGDSVIGQPRFMKS